MEDARYRAAEERNPEITLRRYKVSRHQREPTVKAIIDALELCGAQILEPPDPGLAPFVTTILTPQGERLRLVLYAFTANKYRQAGRPEDEHRFQIKYGGDLSGYHQIHIGDGTSEVTLMLGVHLEAGLFVAVDPAMHAYTRFSRSVEFKEQDLQVTQATGWHGWERDRSSGRRKLPAPREDFRTESVLAFRPENFLRYVTFERVASGMDTGERLLLANRMITPPSSSREPHPLELELGLSAGAILDMIGNASRLKIAVRGSAAEHHLGRYLEAQGEFTRVESIDKDGQPDFSVTFRGDEYLIECKNVLRRTNKSGDAKVDFQKTRASKNNPCSRYYRPNQFHLLAACLHPVTEQWEFRFAATTALAPHKTCEGRLASNVVVNGNKVWGTSPAAMIEAAYLS
jgi:hypothetical protein